MQKAAQLKIVSDEPLIVRHARLIEQMRVKQAEMRARSRAIYSAAFDDGMDPLAFRTVIRLKAMDPAKAKKIVEDIVTYAEDLGIMAQGELFG